jgi:hypothetical protein
MTVRITRAQAAFGASAVACLGAASVALAGSAVGSDDRRAAASASVSKQIKKLKRQLRSQEQRLAALERGQGSSRPPSGPAGGDLTGNYPDPLIASDAVGSSELTDGSIENADLAPEVRAARAYGRVAANGTLSLTRIHNVLDAARASTGVYCIQLGESINPNTAVLLVEPDFTGDSTDTSGENLAVAEWRSGGGFCAAGRMEVWTFVYDGDATDDDDGGGNTTGDNLDVADQPFTFVVP